MATRILTWNLQGRERPDLGAVAEAIASFEADVVALQEVQRRQARAIADRLGWTATWRFKHWPLVVPAEGLALLAPTRPGDVAATSLAGPWRFWSWRRRIAVVLDAFAAAGFRDAWSEVRPDEPGATNWRRGPRDGRPTQRLDYVLVDASLTVESAEVPSVAAAAHDGWGALSDHLPVFVTVSPGRGGSRR